MSCITTKTNQILEALQILTTYLCTASTSLVPLGLTIRNHALCMQVLSRFECMIVALGYLSQARIPILFANLGRFSNASSAGTAQDSLSATTTTEDETPPAYIFRSDVAGALLSKNLKSGI